MISVTWSSVSSEHIRQWLGMSLVHATPLTPGAGVEGGGDVGLVEVEVDGGSKRGLCYFAHSL